MTWMPEGIPGTNLDATNYPPPTQTVSSAQLDMRMTRFIKLRLLLGDFAGKKGVQMVKAINRRTNLVLSLDAAPPPAGMRFLKREMKAGMEFETRLGTAGLSPQPGEGI